ncbi:MAG: DEAD/DEAH box helicase [Cyclobacteriaceae bacterium]
MSFDSLGLSDALLKAVKKQGYTAPSPIQGKAIPLILERKDVLASAQTGTGKTAGFTLPILEILSKQPIQKRRPIKALVLTPTRELAAQVYDNVQSYSEFLDLRSSVIFGGVSQRPQVEKLRKGIDILVATPGRLLDLHNQRLLSLDKIEILVLDEADRMLDMGFLRDIKKIMQVMPSQRQNLLFSATFSKDIKKLANSILNKPVLVEAAPENTTAEKVIQKFYRVDKAKKTSLVTKFISEGDWKQVLIFMRTKHGANRLSEKLGKSGITSAAIHGNKSQNARTKALEGFKKGTVRVLVATDIAARGLDIPLLPHVINFELPNVPEDYVHRIGRTGRAGASGEAISLVSADEMDFVKGIENLLGHPVGSDVVDGYEPTETVSAPNKKGGKKQYRAKGKSGVNGEGNRKFNSGGGNQPKNNSSRSGKPKNGGSSNRRRRTD